MQPRYLALAAGWLPLLTVHTCWLIASLLGQVPACFPYFEGCTSISATGRQYPTRAVFHAGMIPAAVVAAFFWLAAARWLVATGDDARRSRRALAVLGVTASAFLVLYAVTLGISDERYAIARRIGASVYFGFTFFAQLLLTARLYRLAEHGRLPGGWTLARAAAVVVTAMFALGLLSLVAGSLEERSARKFFEYVIEWNFALLMASHFLLVARAWRLGGFRIDYRASRTIGRPANEQDPPA